MKKNYILALDQGTTSSRAVLFDHAGRMVAAAQKEFTQIYPQPGWVEHDPQEIWATQSAMVKEVIDQFDINDIAAIGITNQRETTVIWERATGKPIYNAIVWQDRRTAADCDALKIQGLEKIIRAKTGLPLDAYFSATKIRWILDHVPDARAKAERGELAFGTIDSWLIWNLTQGAVHVTDVSNAARTMLFNIHTVEWDEELLAALAIPRSLLPQVRSSSETVAHTNCALFSSPIAIAGIAGDQHAALFGQMCTSPGMAKNTYGTGCFLMMNTGTTPIESRNNLITTIAWKINGQVSYALEGSIFIGGALVQWLRDELCIIDRADDIEALATSVADSGGVFMVPAFAGLGAPHWNSQARGSVFGLTRGSSRAHIARAALESIAFQSYDVLTCMQADMGSQIAELRVDGGAVENNFLMQFQADLLGVDVMRPQITETTALGAAYLAGLAVGFWKNSEELQQQWLLNRRFSPSMTAEQLATLKKGWQRAVNASIAWADNA